MIIDNLVKIIFCSGIGTVTGANFLLELGAEAVAPSASAKILIDCGLVQGEKVALEENKEKFPYDLNEINALFVTHAHLDHVGRIPKLVKDGYKGPIYSTPQTRDLAELVLNDAVGIIAAEAKQENESPLYDLADVEAVFPLWRTINYHEPLRLNDQVSITLKDAGHILGSAMIEVTNTVPRPFGSALRILFTGDLGNSPAPLLRDTEDISSVDYLVMESVYGNRNHENRESRANIFERVIKESIDRGGTLVIPTFSIDRTQVLLYELNKMVEDGKIPRVPVFVDSPMAIKATQIYKENENLFNDNVQSEIARGDDIFQFPHLEYTMSAGESRDIERLKGAKIILAGSGMSVGGRVIGHERHYLPDPKSTVLLVGYQTPGSLGRQLADGAKKVRIQGENIQVKARVETMYGYSAHKDGDHLVSFVATADKRLKQVFVVMGEPGASMHLAQRIRDELGVRSIVPERGKEYSLK